MTSSVPLEIAVFGHLGRMGRFILESITQDPGSSFCGGTTREMTASEIETVLKSSKVAIDFTAPNALEGNLKAATSTKTPLVIGTTGLNVDHFSRIEAASQHIPILWAPNFSIGINVMMHLVEKAAHILDQHLPGEVDAEIYERHHHHKKDAPSGTALGLGASLMKGRGQEFRLSNQGLVLGKDDYAPNKIAFSISRMANAAGDHRVSFGWTNEVLDISHHSGTPAIFAHGAVTAAKALAGRSPGVYSMADILGL